MTTVAVSKWGNSSGIRIPGIVLRTLNIQNGDKLSYEIRENEVVFRKEKTTEELFEEFYGKPFAEITTEDLGEAEELDWGEEVGSEVLV